MSTIKTTNIGHPSAGSDAITLASDGGIQFNNSVSGTGLDHIATETFSAASSVSLDNVFTSNHENYRVLIFNESDVNTWLRLRASGTDSTASYGWRLTNNYSTTIAAETTATSYWQFQNNIGSLSLDLFRPQKTYRTTGTALSVRRATEQPPAIVGFTGVTHGVALAYDGLTILPSTGTITGSLSVYGYKS